MTTMTAQLIVGHSHPNDGGINPTHWLYLSENSRPAWILSEENLLGASEEEPIEWIPSVEHLVEDALLMIGVCICRDESLLKEITAVVPTYKVGAQLQLTDIPEDKRVILYGMCREKHYRYKIIATIFAGSSLVDCEQVLSDYQIEHEVCHSNKIVNA